MRKPRVARQRSQLRDGGRDNDQEREGFLGIVRGIVTVKATAVTPEDAIGMSVAVKQQDTHRTEQQCQTTERGRKEYTEETVQFEHVAPEQARVRSRSSTMEPLKRPLPDVIMKATNGMSVAVRDPGSRLTENEASSVTFVEVQQPQMVEKYHRTPKMNQATVEPSSALRDSRAVLCLGNLQRPEKFQHTLQVKSRASNSFSVSFPINSINSPGTMETRMNA